MDPNSLKGHLINSYLNQQLSVAGDQDDDVNSDGGALQAIELPPTPVLEEFKKQVRMWIEIDNQIEKLQAAARDRRAIKNQLTEKILKFMGKYNIDALNTRDGGKLRYRVSQVRPPVSKEVIRQRIAENYGKVNNIEELTEIIFARQDPTERVSLRRLKNPNAAAGGDS